MKTETQNIRYSNSTIEQKRYIEDRIKAELGTCQSSLVEELLKREIFSYEDIKNLFECNKFCIECGEELAEDNHCYKCDLDREDHMQEIYQWFAIKSDFLKDELIKLGEPVLENEFGEWWGRTCFGQSIELDPTFWIIFQDSLKHYTFENLEEIKS